MPTLSTLVSSKVLRLIEAQVRKPTRRIYALDEFIEDLEALPGAGDAWNRLGGTVAPADQAAALIDRYQRGFRLNLQPKKWKDLKSLKPYENGIWEFRTYSVRMFGWFCEKDVFVGHRILDKDFLADSKATTGQANASKYRMDELGFQPHEIILTGKITDVLSNQD